MKNIFQKDVTEQVVQRIYALTPHTQPQWGKMNVAQMLAHCNVTYELVYEHKHPKPGVFKRFLLTAFIKKFVVNEAPFPKNSRTSPEFLVADERDFETEKNRLINYILKTQELGESPFEGRESHSFGKLSAQEWNNMFYKHLNHHLTQFGV